MTTVRVKHLRRAGLCGRGARRWAERHGLDWRRFVREGIDAEQLRAHGDGQAELAIREAEHDA